MLQAKQQDGKAIIPANLSKTKQTALKAARPKFYCPSCGEEVILRAGEKVIAHFAHRSQSNCPSSAGGESAYHQQGKLLLYEWLTRQKLQVELEAYLPEIQQRPDFLIHLNGRRIALEYQCSKISNNEIIKRTKGYSKNDMHVIWILGENRLKRAGQQTIRLDTFTRTCMHQFSSDYPSSLFYFCPYTSNLIKFQDISFLRPTLGIGRLSIIPLAKLNFPDLLSAAYLPKPPLINAWKKEKKRFRTRTRNRMYGRERDWHQWMYLNKLHVESLPSIVHIPVTGSHQMNAPGWIWQSKILFEVIAPLKKDQPFTLQQCERLLVRDLDNSDRFPLMKNRQNPIASYLETLIYFGYIEQISPYVFKKIKPILLHTEIQTAITEDNKIIDELFKGLRAKLQACSTDISVY